MTPGQVKRLVEALQDFLMEDDCLALAISERTGCEAKPGQQGTAADLERAGRLYKTRALWRKTFRSYS